MATAPAGGTSDDGHAALAALLAAADPWAVDLLLSALTAAAASYRRASCTTPFPSALFQTADGARDFAALCANLQALPPAGLLARMAAAPPGAPGRLSAQQAALLRWVLEHPRRPVAEMRRCTLRQVQEQLPSLSGWVADIGHNPSLRPQFVLQLAEVPPALGGSSGDASRLLAFHGTGMENVHSILHNGLLNASGTRLERTGAAFGKGIYFSSELPVAFAFCQPADGWGGSALGPRLRCLLVCSIQREHAQGAHNSSEVPDKYIVVQRMDAVQLLFLFVYPEEAPPGAPLAATTLAAGVAAGGSAGAAVAHLQHGGAGSAAAAAAPPPRRAHRRRPSLLLLLLLAYAAWMLAVSVRGNWPYWRRLLRRHLGLRWL